MTSRSFRDGDFERGRESRCDFDPIAEGHLYQLAPEVSLAIWKYACRESTDNNGQRDEPRARELFHQVATRIAARGGRLGPDVGRVTRVGAETNDDVRRAVRARELEPRIPGRTTLALAEARRWMQMAAEPAVVSEPAAALKAPEPAADHDALPGASEVARRMAALQTRSGTDNAAPWEAAVQGLPGASEVARVMAALQARSGTDDAAPWEAAVQELPGASEVARVMAALQARSPTEDAPPDADAQDLPDKLAEASSALPPPSSAAYEKIPASTRMSRLFDVSLPDSYGRARPPEPRVDGRLPDATLEHMERAYGQRFDDVEIHTDSAEVPAGEQAFTLGRHIYFERGAFDLDSEHGEHVLAHELAHVAQQAQPAAHDPGRPVTRDALEEDAHQAALSVLAGRAATVNLFAPPSIALGFSKGKPARKPAPARPPQSAKGGSSTKSPGSPRVSGAPANVGPGGKPAPHPGGAAPGGHPDPAAAHKLGGAPAAAKAPTAEARRRGAKPDGLLVPEAPAALTPGAAGRLQTIQAGNQGVAAATTALPTAEQQTQVARAAVVEPQAEQDAHAQHKVVAGVDDRPPPSPEIVQACDHIRQVIRDKRPPDEDKLVEAKPKEMAKAAGEQMSAGVEQRAGSVRQGYADMQGKPQGKPDTTPVPATLPPEQAQTLQVDAAAGTPDPLKHEDVSLDGDVAAQKQKIQDAGMNTEAGQLVKDGPIGDARGGADDLQTMAKTDPQKVLADQAAAIATAKGDMHALQAAAERALADARAGTVAQIGNHTTGVKGSEEQQRAQAGAQMQGIFTRTQQTVDKLLQPLSGNAVKRWEAGVAQLSTDFETSLADVKQKIDDRHSGVGGWFVSGWDHLTGLPDWVTKDYDRAEAKFGDGATSLITDISRDVNQVIEDCKKLIDQARKDIETVVHSLPASLQSWAQGEADKLGKQLDQLSQRVDQTQHGLNQDLINRANGAVQTVRERVADLREQAKGLLGKIADAIAEFIKDPGKAIINGLLHILGIPPASFWALIDKLGDVISGIAADPKKFANTLMEGVGQGFQQFFHNLPVHLGQALFQWLFSKLGEAGVTMPTDFSMRSIITLALEVMGITWTRIKAILAKHIGAENAEILDQAVKLVQVLIEKGPAGVFEMIKEQLDPAMIIDAIKDAAIQYVMQAIITRVTARILMMLNPAGAILQAIEAIYRVIKWVIDNAARIFTLIESVVNGAAQILAGNVSGVANLVESSLVKLMVPVIDFLADYLGLGGIPNAIKNVILGLQGKVEKILDRVIGFLVEKAKALWQAIKNRGKKPDGQEPKDSDKPTDEAKPEGKVKVSIPFSLRGESHTLSVEEDGDKLAVFMASRKDRIRGKYGRFRHTIENYRQRFKTMQPEVAELLEEEICKLEQSEQDQIEAYAQQIEGLNSKQSEEVLARANAEANQLVTTIVEAAKAFDIEDLTPEMVQKRLEEAEDKAWQQAVQTKREEIQEKLQDFVPRIRALASTLAETLDISERPPPTATVELRYRGSTAKGRKGEHKDYARFDPADFDIDTFIMCDVFIAVAISRGVPVSGEMWANESGISQLRTLEQDMRKRASEIAGLRAEGGLSIKIRSTQNVLNLRRNKAHEGERHVTISPPPENP